MSRTWRHPSGVLVGVALLLAALAGGGCGSSRGPEPPRVRPGKIDRGIASWYGPKFHGRRTANGEVYDMHGLTAAHRSLPFGTWVEVTNLDNGRRVLVRINDRGPFIRGRVLDVSFGAAQELDMVHAGLARVEMRIAAPRQVAREAARVELARQEIRQPEPGGGERPSTHAYLVQVAALSSMYRAELLQEELSASYPQTAIRSDGVWHRVQIGPYDGRGQAEEVVRALERMGYAALVVRSR